MAVPATAVGAIAKQRTAGMLLVPPWGNGVTVGMVASGGMWSLPAVQMQLSRGMGFFVSRAARFEKDRDAIASAANQLPFAKSCRGALPRCEIWFLGACKCFNWEKGVKDEAHDGLRRIGGRVCSVLCPRMGPTGPTTRPTS